MTDEADFDALAREATESGGAMENLNKLFDAAFALPKWFLSGAARFPTSVFS